MQETKQQGKQPRMISRWTKRGSIPIVLAGMGLIVFTSLIDYRIIPFPPSAEKLFIFLAAMTAFFLHLGSMLVFSTERWRQQPIDGCIPACFTLFGILGYLIYLVGIVFLSVPSWGFFEPAMSCLYLSGILSVPLLVLYLQTTPKQLPEGEQ